MAEGSIFESRTSYASSDDVIVKDIQENIGSLVGLVTGGRKDNQELHYISLSSSLDQINQLPVEQGQELVSKSETHDKKLSNLRKTMEIHDDLSQIEVIDEGKEEQVVGSVGSLERNEKKEGKKEKRPRKRGKGLKKHLNAGGVGFIHDFNRQSGCDCEKRGDRARVVYLREDMEALRCVAMEEQKKKWIEVYCGLGPVVAKEYDGLVGSGHGEDENYVNFDPRPRFSNKKRAASANFLGNEPDNVGSEMENTNQLDQESCVNASDLEGSFGEEEDYNEDEDSDAEYVGIQRPAFLVTGEPDFDSGPPQDGLEYLRRVRWETEHIPKVKVAKVEKDVVNKEQTVYMPKIPDIAACPEHLMPSKEWEVVFLADFSELRLNLASSFSGEAGSIPLAPSIIESVIQENHDFCQTHYLIQENPDFCQAEDNTTIGDWPSLQIILGMEPVARATMLRKRITSMETMSSLPRNYCTWLFALCAAIDTPLDADTSASLRCLLRKCASLRAEKPDLDDEVIMLNILATISGKYFGQSETG